MKIVRILCAVLILIQPLTSVAQEIEEVGEEESTIEIAPPIPTAETVIEKKRKSPFQLSGGLEVHPVGYDNIDRDNEDIYLGIMPSADISTEVSMANGKILTLSAHYDLRFRHFVTGNNPNREGGASDFKHNLGFGVNFDIIDKLNFDFSAFAEYLLISTKRNRDELYSEFNPTFTYQMLPTTSASIGYTFVYWNNPGDNIGIDGFNTASLDLPSGPDDLGTHVIEGANSFTDPILDPSAPFQGSSVNTFESIPYFFRHGLTLALKHKFSEQTSVGVNYRFARYFANNDNSENQENWLKVGFSQSLWKNATGSLGWRIRLRDYIYRTGDAGDSGRRDIRNRFYLGINQKLADNWGMKMHYRYQTNHSNIAGAKYNTHQFWLGAYVTF